MYRVKKKRKKRVKKIKRFNGTGRTRCDKKKELHRSRPPYKKLMMGLGFIEKGLRWQTV